MLEHIAHLEDFICKQFELEIDTQFCVIYLVRDIRVPDEIYGECNTFTLQ